MEVAEEELAAALQDLSLSSTEKVAKDRAISFLADASRNNVTARHRLADPAALKTLIEVAKRSMNDSLEALDLALRCIANACADNDAARDAVTDIGFSWALQCLYLPDDTVQILTTKVLFNICSGGHEASQRKCYEIGIHFALMNICAKSGDVDELSFAFDLLLWICEHKAGVEAALSQPISEDSLHELLLLPSLYASTADLETVLSLTETVLVFARDPVVQAQIITTKQLGKLWRILEIQQTKAAALDAENEDAAEDLKLLLALSTSLIWCLSDAAALPEFSRIYSLDDAEFKSLVGYVQTRGAIVGHRGDPNGLQLTAACQIVGNLLWALPVETYVPLITQDQLHRPLFEIIVHIGTAKEDAGVLHSAAGLLIQLSRPSIGVREVIGDDELALPALERLCRHDMSNIQQEGVKLLRSLGRECPVNQQRFAALAREAVVTASENSNAETGPTMPT